MVKMVILTASAPTPQAVTFYTRITGADYTTDTEHLADVGLMLVQRLRRWPNIKPTSAKLLVFSV